VRGARTIVAYHAPFERQCIVQLAEAVPSLAAPLGSIAERLVDLLPIIRNHVYHPDFGGSFSLKRVLPPWCPRRATTTWPSPAGRRQASSWRACSSEETRSRRPRRRRCGERSSRTAISTRGGSSSCWLACAASRLERR
jgi:hypothetical protein